MGVGLEVGDVSWVVFYPPQRLDHGVFGLTKRVHKVRLSLRAHEPSSSCSQQQPRRAQWGENAPSRPGKSVGRALFGLPHLPPINRR